MSEPTEQVDLLLHPDWVLTMVDAPGINTQNSILTNYSVAILAGKIHSIIPTVEARQRFLATFEFNLPNSVVLPGLINSHAHAAMSLFRGFADDLPLHTWLTQYIWPAEQKWVSADFVRIGTAWSLLEGLLSGTTCTSDMYFFPEAAAKVAQEFGVRCLLSSPVFDFPTAWGDSVDTYLQKTEALMIEFRDHPLIKVGVGPHAPYTVSDQPLIRCVELAKKYNSWVQMHVHETEQEVTDAVKATGTRPIKRLHDLGILSSAFQMVHMTALNEEDFDILKKTGASVIHCPQSNLKLASGFCPVHQLLQQGTRVAIGTDGSASNNDVDMLDELKTAALLAKAVAKDATALPAYHALYLATKSAADTFGMSNEIGSLAPGLSADLIAINLSAPNTQPVYDPVSQVVYSANSSQVQHVWVRGQHRVAYGEPVDIDVKRLLNELKTLQKKLITG
ncbi:MAG: TRZ/ATZ family hydrolase [Pseudomonadota bacterium]